MYRFSSDNVTFVFRRYRQSRAWLQKVYKMSPGLRVWSGISHQDETGNINLFILCELRFIAECTCEQALSIFFEFYV